MRLLGGIGVFSGVLIAILFARRQATNRLKSTDLEPNIGPLWIGLLFGLLAALCQSLGTLLAKPVMSSGVDPVAASCTRMAMALMAHLLLRATGAPFAKAKHPINTRVLLIIAGNGFLAMALGMTLILLALQHGEMSMVAILSSTTPVMILPLLWLYTRQRPTLAAWLGAGLVCGGTTLVLTAGR